MTYHDEAQTQAILQGDKKTFETFFCSMYSRLKAFAVRFTETEEDAEDIVQDAFMSLWEKVGATTPDDASIRSVTAYIFQTVRNKALNYVQHHQMVLERVTRIDDTEMVESLTALDMTSNTEQDTIYRELTEQINTLVNRMPARQREVFVLSRSHEMSNQEIANQLGVSIKAVEKHITASLKFLREHLSTHYLLLLIILSTPL